MTLKVLTIVLLRPVNFEQVNAFLMVTENLHKTLNKSSWFSNTVVLSLD